MFERAKEFFESGSILALATRLGLGAFLGVISGSSVLGFVSQYGLFFFAFHHGARIPVEGLDVLSPAVVLFSFILSISVAFLIVAVYGITLIARRLFGPILEKFKSEKIKKYKEQILSVIGALVSASATLFASMEHLFGGEISQVLAVALAVVVFLFFLLLLLAANQGFVKYFILFSALTVILTSLVFVLQPENFAKFLRESRFGGEVDVEINLQNDPENKKKIDGQLFLRTSNAFYVYNRDKTGQLIEVPASNVETIIYKENFISPEELYR